MFAWWQRRKLAKIADRQRRWALLKVQELAEELYDTEEANDHRIGSQLFSCLSKLPPADFK